MNTATIRRLLVAALLLTGTAASAAPDLVVDSITLDPSSPPAGSGTLIIVFKNIGPDDVNLSFTEYTNYTVALDGSQCDASYINDLAAGDTNQETTSSCNPSTPGPHTITVTIDSDGDVSESNESNNVGTKTFTWAGPDLIVESISLDPAKPPVGEGSLSVTFKNVGTADVDLGITNFTNYRVTLDGAECDTGFISDLAKGDTNPESLSGNCNATTPGPHDITVEIDSDKDVAETNEANNTLTKTFTWRGPDLVVASIALDPATPDVGEGKLTIVFENIGGADVNLPLNQFTNYTVAVDGVECDASYIFDLNAGDTNTETTTSCVATTPGPHDVTVTIDSDGDVAEEDETNNSRTQTFTWAGGPDLVITEIKLDPADAGYDSGTLVATIANQGNAGTGVLVVINVDMYLDGEKCDSGLIIGGLSAGSTATEETTSCNPSTPGEHTIRFVVDVDEDVLEKDETNNSLEKTFTWTAPDLVVTDITAAPEKLEPGKKTTFTATVENKGPVGTGIFVNINLVMYLDGVECDTGLIIAGLGAGSTATEETTSCTPETGGPHTIRFDVDTDEDVLESDETNNSFEKVFVYCTDTELCNGLDDDCDGSTDEDFALGVACDGDDADTCKNGLTVCGEGGQVVCQESGAAQVEVCDGKDNDCDGQTDEDFTQVGKACTPTSGGCPTGVWACDDQGGVTCNAAGTNELCNGVDDDCDGETDEDFADVLGAACHTGVGACEAVGTYACAGGSGVSCVVAAPVAPTQEVCDNAVDDDCDGATDEGCPCTAETFLPCGTDVGACARGYQACEGGVWSAVCAGGTGPATETCGDSKDDDCDGTTDEGCACAAGASRTCALGTCQSGTQPCLDGSWGPCVAGQLAAESCNGADDDCDGETDEGCTCTEGAITVCLSPPDNCWIYEQTCSGGVPGPCAPRPGSENPSCTPASGDTGGPGADTTGPGADAGSIPGADAGTGSGGDAGPVGTGDAVLAGQDAGAGALPAAPAASDGSGCAVTPTRAPAAAALLLLLLAALALRRRRSSTPAP